MPPPGAWALRGAPHLRVPSKLGKRRWVSRSGPTVGPERSFGGAASRGRRVRRMDGGLRVSAGATPVGSRLLGLAA